MISEAQDMAADEQAKLPSQEALMPKADEMTTHTVARPRLVTIASADNPNLLMSATTYPQTNGTPVVFDLLTEGTLQPFSWWVLNPVSVKRDVFQILFHPHKDNLCLTAATTPNAPLTLATRAPANMLQLWTISKNVQGSFIISSYHSKNDIGFPDIPLKGTGLQLMSDPAFHDTADPFQIRDVKV